MEMPPAKLHPVSTLFFAMSVLLACAGDPDDGSNDRDNSGGDAGEGGQGGVEMAGGEGGTPDDQGGQAGSEAQAGEGGGAMAGQGGGGATGGKGGSVGNGGGQGGGSAGHGGAKGGEAGHGGTAGSGGTAGNGGMAGTGGATAYNPCPAAPTACKVMPLGDSITKGEGDRDNGYVDGKTTSYEGYRRPLWDLAAADGKHMQFVGTMSDGSAQFAHKSHEGHSGWYSRDFIEGRDRLNDPPGNESGSLDVWLAANQADIILFMLGANDVVRADLPTSRNYFRQILDKIYAAKPNAMVLVGTVTYASDESRNGQIDGLNQMLQEYVAADAGKGKHVMLVDTKSSITKADLNDGPHPSAGGYKKLAAAWYAPLRSLLR